MSCQHLNVDITEIVSDERTYKFLNGRLADTSASGAPLPRQFHVHCHDCNLDRMYRYGPGIFGPQSSPAWLYDRLEASKNVADRFPRTKRKRTNKSAAL